MEMYKPTLWLPNFTMRKRLLSKRQRPTLLTHAYQVFTTDVRRSALDSDSILTAT